MSLAVKMKRFKGNSAPPSEMFAGSIRTFGKVMEDAHDRLRNGPADVNAVFHDGSSKKARFRDFSQYYAFVAVLWKKAALDHGVYLEYEYDKRNLVVGDVFHRVDVDGVPLLFVCNTRETSSGGEQGFARVIASDEEVLRYTEAAIYCDGLYRTASETFDFFEMRRKTPIYQITLDHDLIVCRSMEDVHRLARSIDSDSQFDRIVKALLLSMERSEFSADTNNMFNRRAFAMACHELGHVAYE